MLLQSIKLHNIRSYTEQKVAFPQGTLLLSGDIGAGKSTILYAVEFALFGLKRGSLAGAALLRNGKNEGSVGLQFEVDGKQIIIHRTLKRAKTGIKQDAGYIIIDGKKTDLTASELKSRIFSLIGYPQNLVSKSEDMVYRYTVYTPQEDMKHILFANPQERLDTLRRVFGIDKYKRLSGNAATYVKDLKSTIRVMQSSLSDVEDKKTLKKVREQKASKLKDDLMHAADQVLTLTDKVALAKGAMKKAETLVSAYHEAQKNDEVFAVQIKEKSAMQQNLSQNHEKLTHDIAELEKKHTEIEIKDTPDIGAMEVRVKELQKILTDTEKKRALLKEKVTLLTNQSDALEKELASVLQEETYVNNKKEIETIEHDLAKRETIAKRRNDLEQKNTSLKESSAQLSLLIKNSEQLTQKVSELDDCPTCLQTVPHEHKGTILDRESKQRAQHQQTLTQLQSEIEQLGAEHQECILKLETLQKQEVKLSQLRTWCEEFEKQAGQRKQKEQRLKEIQQECAHLQKELATLDPQQDVTHRQQLDEQQKTLASAREAQKLVQQKQHLAERLTDKKKQLEQIASRRTTLEKEIAVITQKRGEYAKTLATLKEAHVDYTNKKQFYEKLREEHQQLLVIKTRLEGDHKAVLATVEEIDKELAARKRTEVSIQKSKQLASWLETKFINLMNTIEKHVMVRINQEFNELFKGWFEMLVEDGSMDVSIDDAFTPLVHQNGYDVDVEHLSGGEKTAVALAYRLALNKVINDLIKNIKTNELIILDEPTDGFSSEQLDKVREVLDQINNGQTIIVSHDPKIESFVENILRIEKAEHVSHII